MRFPVVLFDLDGTVIDSGPIILASMRHATLSVLNREISDHDLMASVGGPGLEAQMAQIGGGEQVDELVRVYRAHNEPLHDELQLCPGMAGVLQQLKSEGRQLGIVTAKRRTTAELAFRVTGIGELFDVVVGGDEAPSQKPEPGGLLLALERLGAVPAVAAYVGDSPFDMAAARAGGLHAVGVTWGGVHDAQLLADAGAEVIVDTAEELLAAL